MRESVEIEDIQALRRRAGITDTELVKAIAMLKVGDVIKLTLLLVGKSGAGETLQVRITSIQGNTFRGVLAAQPGLHALAHLRAGSRLAFTPRHIHSIASSRLAVKH